MNRSIVAWMKPSLVAWMKRSTVAWMQRSGIQVSQLIPIEQAPSRLDDPLHALV
jgi:hypothetical protein